MSIHPHPDEDFSEVSRQVQAERVHTLYRITPESLVGGAVFAVLLAWAVLPTAGPGLALGWLALKLFTQLGRGLDWHDWRRHQGRAKTAPRPVSTRSWRVRHSLGSGLDGLGWGIAGWLFIPSGDPLLDGVLLASLVGVASVGVFTLTSLSTDAVRFMLGVLTPVALHHAWQGGTAQVLLSVGIVIYVLVLHTECRRAELRQTELLRLRFENAAIANRLHEAVLQAEHSNTAKGRFLATVSHELRTPLNGILGMTELMSADALSAPQRERLLVIRQSAQYLQTLIGDVLDISRIEFGRLELVLQDVNLARLIQEVHALLAPVAAERGLALSLQLAPDLPSAARLDPVRVKQVLHNLLGNAIKFTPQGWVKLAVREELNPQGRWLSFTVEDSGQGIAPQELARIFNAFEQGGASSDTRRAGTGLGLTISRQLAQAMGGDVLCHSTLGQGATFTFNMRWHAPLGRPPAPPPLEPVPPARPMPTPAPCPKPCAPQADSAGEHPASQGAAAEPARILVVEDNPVNALVAQGMLEMHGLRADWAEDGAQALERMAARHYALVLMDCQMPVLDGWQATQRWRELEKTWAAEGDGTPRLPIIALTANAVSGDRERCLACGMDDYLAKPFDGSQLLAMLDTYFARLAPNAP